MSGYKTLSTYNSGPNNAPVRSPLVMYGNTPLRQELAPQEVVPSYGTVGYASEPRLTYRGYTSLCSAFNPLYGAACGTNNPEDPCYTKAKPVMTQNCLTVLNKILELVNTQQMDYQFAKAVAQELDPVMYDDLTCTNAVISNGVDDLANRFVDGLKQKYFSKRVIPKNSQLFTLKFDNDPKTNNQVLILVAGGVME